MTTNKYRPLYLEAKQRWNKMYSNPFDSKEKIAWHHINDVYLVAMPKDLHELYHDISSNRFEHRENLLPILKQIYPNRMYI